jgi:branched-chain amino acid aminotransferase
MTELVYVNGELVPAQRAVVPLLDRGYLYGEGLFETMRSYGGRIFALDRHLRRLFSSARELDLAIGVGEGDLDRALTLTLEANGLSDAYLRLTVSQQCDAPGIESRAAGRFTVSVIARPLSSPSSQQARGTSLTILQAGSAPPAHLARHKPLSYLAFVRARAAARSAEADEALLANVAGEITEAATANVFFVRDGRLVTPSLSCGLLSGITREIVLELARSQGVEIAETSVRPSDIPACSECFLTNSIVELQPVTSIDAQPVGAAAPGPVWAKLAAAYSQATVAIRES